MDLKSLYRETDGFKSVPAKWVPGSGGAFLPGVKENARRKVAEGRHSDGGNFVVHQFKNRTDLWMDTFRPDGTLAERQHYDPKAVAYAESITRYDRTGMFAISYIAHAQDGRKVDEIRLEKGVGWKRTTHTYPDIKEDILV